MSDQTALKSVLEIVAMTTPCSLEQLQVVDAYMLLFRGIEHAVMPIYRHPNLAVWWRKNSLAIGIASQKGQLSTASGEYLTKARDRALMQEACAVADEIKGTCS